jgi:hypothetical protein
MVCDLNVITPYVPSYSVIIHYISAKHREIVCVLKHFFIICTYISRVYGGKLYESFRLCLVYLLRPVKCAQQEEPAVL